MRFVFVVIAFAVALGCAPAPLHPAPPSNGSSSARASTCDAQVVREALPIGDGDERILLSAGADELGQLVLNEDAQSGLYGENQSAARRATCMGGTHYRLVHPPNGMRHRHEPTTFIVYRVARSHLRLLPLDMKPVALR